MMAAITCQTYHVLRYMIVLQVDILYLHNAEESQRAQLGDKAFMERLKAAFEWLEKARAQSRIQVCSGGSQGVQHLSSSTPACILLRCY